MTYKCNQCASDDPCFLTLNVSETALKHAGFHPCFCPFGVGIGRSVIQPHWINEESKGVHDNTTPLQEDAQ
jgi:hypothetical protein